MEKLLALLPPHDSRIFYRRAHHLYRLARFHRNTRILMKYHFVIDTKDEIIYEFDTDSEPPRVGEWIELDKFNIDGFFEVKRVVHTFCPDPDPTWIWLRVKKNKNKFKQLSRYPKLKPVDL